MELIVYFAVFFAGVMLGWFKGINSLAKMMLQDPKKFEQMMRDIARVHQEARLEDDVANQRETVIDIDREHNQYYAYSQKGEFLAQGQDFRSLLETIKGRFPGRSFRINKYNPKLTEEETQRLISSLFETFGDKAEAQSSQKS